MCHFIKWIHTIDNINGEREKKVAEAVERKKKKKRKNVKKRKTHYKRISISKRENEAQKKTPNPLRVCICVYQYISMVTASRCRRNEHMQSKSRHFVVVSLFPCGVWVSRSSVYSNAAQLR